MAGGKERGTKDMPILSALLLSLLAQPSDPEARIVEYLRANVAPGKPVVVSELYNTVFTSPEERKALNRLFNTFFKIPLFVAQFQKAQGSPPRLAEIHEQFGFSVPGEADVILRIMESDPRMPKFLTRDPQTGEITSVDVTKITEHPRFGKLLERTITGWEGTPAPAFALTRYDGTSFTSQELAGKPHLVYFWFTNCPPCVKTSPLLVELYAKHFSAGFEIVAVNADRVLELDHTDGDRATYAKKLGIPFPLVHMTPEVQTAYGGISVFPTLFFVDRGGVVVEHLVNYHDKATLEEAIRLALR
jgi:thiol-disulfide isomerase/thioredoxin